MHMDSPSRHFSPSAALPNLAPPPSRHRVSFPGKAGIFSSSEILGFSSVQSLSCVRLFVTPWTAACQASLSTTNFWSPPNPCPLSQWCHPTISSSVVPFSSCLQRPCIRVFSNESALRIRWPKYWTFSFNISPSNEHPGLISFRMDWLDLLAV